MTDMNPNDEPKQDPPEEALPTAMMPENADVAGLPSTTADLRLISFYLPSRSEPLISQDTVITIGRRDPRRKINPTIDLTEERGAQLGVSRLHVEINYQKGRYYLKDMGSANGTWINNSKLVPYQPHPVESGDQIRLGQLAIMVHITIPERTSRTTSPQAMIDTITDTDFSFRLTTHTGKSLVQAQGGFAPTILEDITTVLKSVEKFYSIIRDAQQQDVEGFSIIRIRTEPMEGAILVDVKGGIDVLEFLTTKFHDFVKVLEGGEAISAAMERAMEVAHADKHVTVAEQVAEYALQELVYRFLSEQRKDYVQQLAPHIETLVKIPLELISA